MKISVDKQIELKFFYLTYANDFFEAIQKTSNCGDSFIAPMHRKYVTLNSVIGRIHDAVENKFKVDGTPDFFIYFEIQQPPTKVGGMI